MPTSESVPTHLRMGKPSTLHFGIQLAKKLCATFRPKLAQRFFIKKEVNAEIFILDDSFVNNCEAPNA